MTRWIPTNDPPPPDDHHTWAKPAPDDCPNCVCCSKRLCEQAIAANKAGDDFKGACHFIGSSPDFDLADCPCWRDLPGHLPQPADHPYRKAAGER